MSSTPKLSIVVPVYNGATTIEELHQRIRKVVDDFELIFVEDGGSDNSWEVIRKIHQSFPNEVKGVQLAKNFGQNNATICGICEASGEYVLTMDDDLQNPPEEIPKLIKAIEEKDCDLVYGFFKHKYHSFIRNMGGRFLGWIFKLLAKGFKLGSSFRLMKGEIASQICENKEKSEFLELLVHWETSKINYVEVLHERRKSGQSGYNLFKLIRIGLRLIFSPRGRGAGFEIRSRT